MEEEEEEVVVVVYVMIVILIEIQRTAFQVKFDVLSGCRGG